jgi:hypothetical protein
MGLSQIIGWLAMDVNSSTKSLVKRAVIEARILKWYKRPGRRDAPPSRLLTLLTKPKKGIQLQLTRGERKAFVGLIRRINKAGKIILKYRRQYGRRPRLFYEKVFGFPPRESQSVRVVWGVFNIHFVFKRNDLIWFWRRVKWGGGSGCYCSVGDRDVKIQDLRGLVSIGREEGYYVETMDTVRHESMHAFEDYVKGRKPPSGRKARMYYGIKSELNAYLNNFKHAGKKRGVINVSSRRGMGAEVEEQIDSYLSYSETLKRIRNLKSGLRKARTKKEKRLLSGKLTGLKGRLGWKRRVKARHMGVYRRTVNQVKKALEVMPADVLRGVIYETPYERLHRKMPDAVKAYKRMRYEWYRTEG